MTTFKNLFEMPLELSPLNHAVAKDNKRHVLVHMHPQHFLDLTTGASSLDFHQQAQDLGKYNEYVHSGSTLNSPFLNVDPDGQVTGHEGRHRAAALIRNKDSAMPVHIRVNGVGRDGGWEHVPGTLKGQYHDRTVAKSDLTLLKDKVSKL